MPPKTDAASAEPRTATPLIGEFYECTPFAVRRQMSKREGLRNFAGFALCVDLKFYAAYPDLPSFSPRTVKFRCSAKPAISEVTRAARGVVSEAR